MPLLIKARLGDLIHILDEASGEPMLTIEIDSTRKNSARLSFDAPDHIRIEREKCEDRVEPTIAKRKPNLPFVTEGEKLQAILDAERSGNDGLPNLHTQPDSHGSEATA